MPAKDLSKGKNYFHVYNSGVEKRIIFGDAQDYETFEGFLNDYLCPPVSAESVKKVFTVHGKTFRGTPHQPKNYFGQIELLAYSLMPSHFHLILHQKADRSLPSFIRSLCTRYSMYFNKKQHRSGSLFEGPYKSAYIKDVSLLSPLTNYIHHGANDYSSYPEYSGKRETQWVNTSIVQSQGKNGSKQAKKDLPKEITLENEGQYLEGRDLSTNIDNSMNIDKSKGSGSRFFEISALTAIFFILLGLGLRNIKISQAKNLAASPPSAPEVLSESVQEDIPKTLVVVEISDVAGFINIRQEPLLHSEKIGEAKNGESFELVGVNSGWYKVKLPNNLTGYILAKYAHLQQTNN